MREGGHVVAERLVDEDLARGVREVVVAADDVCDPHVRVVAYDSEVVGGRAVGAHDDHVVHYVGGEGDVPVHGVVELDGAVVKRHLQAPNMRFTCVDAALRLGGVDVAARAVVSRVAAFLRFRLRALLVEQLLRAEAGVNRPAVLQALERGLVGVEALGLEVRARVAADLGTLVPVEVEPLHGVQDDLDVLFGRALGVGVLDAQDEGAAHRAGECPVIDCGARAADVQAPSGRGCEAYAYGFVSHGFLFRLLEVVSTCI